MLKVLTIDDPKSLQILQSQSMRVKKIDRSTSNLINEMLHYVASNDSAAGLAAPQVGVLQRVIVITTKEHPNPKPIALVNPVIIEASEEKAVDYEGCLSIPDKYGLVERSVKIRVKYQNRYGKNMEMDAEDFTARVLQHEIDHINGILFTQHMKEGEKLLTKDELREKFEAESALA